MSICAREKALEVRVRVLYAHERLPSLSRGVYYLKSKLMIYGVGAEHVCNGGDYSNRHSISGQD